MADLLLRPLGVGEIIDHSLAIYRRQFAPLFLITLMANGLPLVVGIYVTTAGGVAEHTVLWLVNMLFSVVLGALATAATLFIVSETYLGRTISAGEAFSRATRYIGRLVLLSFAMALLIGLGFLLLIVPGFIALSGLLVSTQALVLEDSGPGEALSRSWSLTKGHRWKMLGLVIVIGIIIMIPTVALSFLMMPSAMESGVIQYTTTDVVWIVVQQLVTIIIYPLLYCALTVAYYDLRVRKEGFDLELLESTLAHALPPSRGSDSRDIPKPRTFG